MLGCQTLPGIAVTVIRQDDRKIRQTGTTDSEGIASFSLRSGVAYDIEARTVGFKTARVKSVSFGTVTDADGKVVDRHQGLV